MTYCGIDLHANNMVNVVTGGNGKVVREVKLPTATRSLEDFFATFTGPVPGLGKVGAWTILAEVGDITRFPSARQFTSYCRLVPGAKDSGGSRRHKSGNNDGNRYLRAAFGQAAVSAYTHYKVVRKFYRKIKRRSSRPVSVASQTCWPQPINPQA